MAALAAIGAAAVAAPDAPDAAPAATVLPKPHQDAALIAIGREAAALIERRKPLSARFWALPIEQGAELQAISDAMEPIDDRIDELLNQALELPATTREGLTVKARLIRHEMYLCHSSRGVEELCSMDPGDRLAWSLVKDLLDAGETV